MKVAKLIKQFPTCSHYNLTNLLACIFGPVLCFLGKICFMRLETEKLVRFWERETVDRDTNESSPQPRLNTDKSSNMVEATKKIKHPPILVSRSTCWLITHYSFGVAPGFLVSGLASLTDPTIELPPSWQHATQSKALLPNPSPQFPNMGPNSNRSSSRGILVRQPSLWCAFSLTQRAAHAPCAATVPSSGAGWRGAGEPLHITY